MAIPKLNGVGVTPPPDAIREFEVLTHTYDASFGRNAGGQINVVLNSGTQCDPRDVLGSFSAMQRSTRGTISRRTRRTPRYQRNQFGFSIGGPIRKDRTFFFGDYEGTAGAEGITRITNVPTAPERAGDFSQSAQPPINLVHSSSPSRGISIPAQRSIRSARRSRICIPCRIGAFPVRTTFRRRCCATARITSIPGWIIASARRPILRFGTVARTACCSSHSPERLFARVPGFGNDVARRAQNVMASETHVFTPSLINEVRLGFNRVAQGVSAERRTQHESRGRAARDLVQ